MKTRGLRTAIGTSLTLILAVSDCSSANKSDDQATATSASETATSQTDNSEMVSKNLAAGMNRFGGPVYNADPALDVTAALVKTGGVAENFSFEKALVSTFGEDTVKTEVAALTQKYGAENVQSFVQGMEFAVVTGVSGIPCAGGRLNI